MSKYGNKKTDIDGITFDSKKEATAYCELRLLLRAGKIKDLRMQVPYEIVPSVKIHGVKQRAVKYIADFVYIENGQEVVEDVKGVRTREYVIKRKLMKHVHGIDIRET